MNGEQQRQHKTVTDALRRNIAELSLALADEVNETTNVLANFETRLNETQAEAAHHISNLTRAISDLDESHTFRMDELGRGVCALETFRGRGFWSRLNWLLTGR